jgi:hypothetical protein
MSFEAKLMISYALVSLLIPMIGVATIDYSRVQKILWTLWGSWLIGGAIVCLAAIWL